MKGLTTLSLFTVVLSFPHAFALLIVHEKRDVPFRNPINRQRIDANTILPMRIGLKSNAESLANAENWLMAISDPDSPQYGRYWSQKDVIEAFKPSEETIEAVTQWLLNNSVTEFTHSDNKMWFAFDMFAKQAESMLQTVFFTHERPNGRIEASCDQYFLPEYLQPHIDYITPGLKGSDITARTARSQRYKRIRKSFISHCK